MTKEEAKSKKCPFRSQISDRECITSDCMFWVRYINKHRPFDGVHNKLDEVVFLYNGHEEQTIVEGNCSLLILLEKMYKEDKSRK